MVVLKPFKSKLTKWLSFEDEKHSICQENGENDDFIEHGMSISTQKVSKEARSREM